MTTPEIESLSPLSDQSNVMFVVVGDDDDEGFTPAEVWALLNAPTEPGEPLNEETPTE